jgi:hypothetical protein
MRRKPAAVRTTADFVNAAVVCDELEIRPSSKRLLVRQALAEIVERVPLPRKLGLGDSCATD